MPIEVRCEADRAVAHCGASARPSLGFAFSWFCRPLRECRGPVCRHAMQKIEIALSPHARPQALDNASYPRKPDFWKGLGLIHLGRGVAADVCFG